MLLSSTCRKSSNAFFCSHLSEPWNVSQCSTSNVEIWCQYKINSRQRKQSVDAYLKEPWSIQLLCTEVWRARLRCKPVWSVKNNVNRNNFKIWNEENRKVWYVSFRSSYRYRIMRVIKKKHPQYYVYENIYYTYDWPKTR